jgi:hypothetical protein
VLADIDERHRDPLRVAIDPRDLARVGAPPDAQLIGREATVSVGGEALVRALPVQPLALCALDPQQAQYRQPALLGFQDPLAVLGADYEPIGQRRITEGSRGRPPSAGTFSSA